LADDTVRVEGLRELRNTLRRLGDTDIPDAIKKANKDAAEKVAADARRRAPVRSGRLRDSIRSSGQALAAIVREGNAKVPYAGWIDYGGTIRPHGEITRPFLPEGRILTPALNAQRDEIVDQYEQAINRVLRERDVT
jgi:phage gpG-like protein